MSPNKFQQNLRNCMINNVYKVNTENQDTFPQSKDSLRYSRSLNISKTGSEPHSSGYTKVEEHKGNQFCGFWQQLSAEGSCTREKDISDTWWNLRKTEYLMNHKFSGFTTVLLALLKKCKSQSLWTQGPGPHHAWKSVRVEENAHVSTHTCRDTKAEHANQWMSNGMGRVHLVDSYETFPSSWTIFIPFLQFEVIAKWKAKVQWLLASGCWYTTLWVQWMNSFRWLFCVAYHNKNNDYKHPCHKAHNCL